MQSVPILYDAFSFWRRKYPTYKNELCAKVGFTSKDDYLCDHFLYQRTGLPRTPSDSDDVVRILLAACLRLIFCTRSRLVLNSSFQNLGHTPLLSRALPCTFVEMSQRIHVLNANVTMDALQNVFIILTPLRPGQKISFTVVARTICRALLQVVPLVSRPRYALFTNANKVLLLRFQLPALCLPISRLLPSFFRPYS